MGFAKIANCVFTIAKNTHYLRILIQFSFKHAVQI
jgi:hypothetical protein